MRSVCCVPHTRARVQRRAFFEAAAVAFYRTGAVSDDGLREVGMALGCYEIANAIN